MHALADSIEPTRRAFARHWPSAEVAHLLDGSLYLDRSRGTADATELAHRVRRLLDYSVATGAEAILFTGSFFGDAVRRARATMTVPVATSFEGLVERALDDDAPRPLHVLATAADSLTFLTTELLRAGAGRTPPLTASGQVVTGAMEALVAGDAAEHDRRVLAAVRAAAPEATVVLAQFSMERVLDDDGSASARSVIGPASAGAAYLRRCLAGHDRH